MHIIRFNSHAGERKPLDRVKFLLKHASEHVKEIIIILFTCEFCECNIIHYSYKTILYDLHNFNVTTLTVGTNR